MLNAKYYFHRRKMILREKYSLKFKAGIVSHTKSNNSLTNALVKDEAEYMPDIFENKISNLKLYTRSCVY
jgi:hypothetical protein